MKTPSFLPTLSMLALSAGVFAGDAPAAPEAPTPISAISISHCKNTVAVIVTLDATHLVSFSADESIEYELLPNGEHNVKRHAGVPGQAALAFANKAPLRISVETECDGMSTGFVRTGAPERDEIDVLILLTLVNGDTYSKVLQMPAHSSHKDCLNAGAQWLSTQKPQDNPQYLCVIKSQGEGLPETGA